MFFLLQINLQHMTQVDVQSSYNNIYQSMLLWQKDRRMTVVTPKKYQFPNNCIGCLKTLLTNNGEHQQKNGTGFLISSCLVLTSANLFISQSKNHQMLSLFPITFILAEQKNGNQQYKIENFKVNLKFLQISRDICDLNHTLQKESNSMKKIKLAEQIMALFQERANHDFALLKLSQRVRRFKYFQLMTNLQTPSYVRVSGYSSTWQKDLILLTHANKIAQIKKGIIFYDVDTGNGQIGSPVHVEDQGNKVLGIHLGYHARKRLNYATMITENSIDTLQKWSLQLKSPFQAVNSNQYIDSDEQIYKNEKLYKGEDRRQQIKAQKIRNFPYNAIGWLLGKDRFGKPVIGTGFLISNCFILTSAHTIHQIIDRNKFKVIPLTFSIFGLERSLQIQDFRINLKFEDIQNQISSLRKIKQTLKALDPKNFQEQEQLRNQIRALIRQQSKYDFALLKLSQKIIRSQYFGLLQGVSDYSKPLLALSGYINSLGSQFNLMTHSGEILDIRAGTIFYDIDTTGGQSGSPVYIKNQPNKVVGIHKAGSDQDQMNFGTMITREMVELLRKWSIQMKPFFKVTPKSK